MIKTDKIDVLLGRMDKLISIMETRVEENRTKRSVERPPVTKTTTVGNKKKVLRRYKQFSQEFYASLAALAPGARTNITAVVRDASIPLGNVMGRVSNWAWLERKNGNDKSFHVVKQGWEIYVERTR